LVPARPAAPPLVTIFRVHPESLLLTRRRKCRRPLGRRSVQRRFTSNMPHPCPAGAALVRGPCQLRDWDGDHRSPQGSRPQLKTGSAPWMNNPHSAFMLESPEQVK